MRRAGEVGERAQERRRQRDEDHRAAVREADVEVAPAEILDHQERQIARDDVQREGGVGEIVERPGPERSPVRLMSRGRRPPIPRAPRRGTGPSAATCRRGRADRAPRCSRPATSRSSQPLICSSGSLTLSMPPVSRSRNMYDRKGVLALEGAVVDHRDQALDLDVEVALLVDLAQERVLDVLPVLDATRSAGESPRRIEGLGLQQDAAARPADRHRDLAASAAAAHGREVGVGEHRLHERELPVALAEPAEIAVHAHAAHILRDARHRSATSAASASASRSPMPGNLAAGRRRVAAAPEGLRHPREIDRAGRASAGSSRPRSWCRRARRPRSASPCPRRRRSRSDSRRTRPRAPSRHRPGARAGSCAASACVAATSAVTRASASRIAGV